MTRFDLSGTQGYPDAKRARRVHGTLRALFGLGILGLGYLAASHAISRGWTATTAGFVAMEVVACGLYGWVVVMTGPGASFLDAAEEGIVLSFGHRRTRRLNWSDPEFSLILVESLLRPESDSRARWIEFGSGAGPVTTFLTPEAFDAVVHGARLRGLRVEVHPLARPGWSWYRIGPPVVR